MNASYYVEQLNMQSHPEGGYFVETYRSSEKLDFAGFTGTRSLATSILFLLEQGQVSSAHRIKSDEIWYHHDGGMLEIIEWDEHGQKHITKLGKNLERGEVLQYVVKANRWFGSKPGPNTDFVLVGCQVSPGFDFQDFELSNDPKYHI
jgi:predicted cupin superfamily sugar epimerase